MSSEKHFNELEESQINNFKYKMKSVARCDKCKIDFISKDILVTSISRFQFLILLEEILLEVDLLGL